MAVTDERVSRARLLKRAGVGAAALGGASMLTAATASAVTPTATTPSKACIHNGCGVCENLITCGDSGCCACFTTVEGCCFCAGDWFCDTALTCTSSHGCPPGWACVRSCCDEEFGYHTQCVPRCGTTTPFTAPCEDTPVQTSRPTAMARA